MHQSSSTNRGDVRRVPFVLRLGAGLALGALGAAPARAQNIAGINGAACAHSTVAAAIAAAPAGATVYIAPGTYAETFGVIAKDLTLVAANAACTSVAGGGVYLDANDVNRVATIDADVTLRNLTLTDGTALRGGLLYVGPDAHLVLDGTDLIGGTATTTGGALYVTYGTATLLNGSIIGLSEALSGDGGGVAVVGGQVFVYDDSRIGGFLMGNVADGDGGGISVNGGGLLLADDALVRDNVAQGTGEGGGIYATNGAWVELDDDASVGDVSSTSGNSAWRGGGIAVVGTGTSLTLRGDGGVRYNYATMNGGGVHVDGADLDMSGDTTIHGNIAGNDGGGIHAENTTVLAVTAGAITYNEAGVTGGGVQLVNSEMLIRNVAVDGNAAPIHGGGGFYVLDSTLEAYNLLVRDNTAQFGAGLWVGGDLGSTLRIDADFESCDPALLPADTYCSELRGNQSDDSGSALRLDAGTASIRHTAVLDNASGLVSGFGADVLIHYTSSSATVAHSLFAGNLGTYTVNNYSGALDARHNTFTDNAGIAVRYAPSTTGELHRNVFWANGTGPSIGVVGGIPGSCNDLSGLFGTVNGVNNLFADPLFVTTARGDYRLSAASPAVNACAAGSGPDLDGVPRPRGGAYDMGAFERVP